jgi:hypothetical protein
MTTAPSITLNEMGAAMQLARDGAARLDGLCDRRLQGAPASSETLALLLAMRNLARAASILGDALGVKVIHHGERI